MDNQTCTNSSQIQGDNKSTPQKSQKKKRKRRNKKKEEKIQSPSQLQSQNLSHPQALNEENTVQKIKLIPNISKETIENLYKKLSSIINS